MKDSSRSYFLLSYCALTYCVMGGVGGCFWFGFFFFSFNFYFFIFLNPKWQVIFFLVFSKNVNWTVYEIFGGFPDGWNCKESACNEWVGNIPLEKEMATHSSILAQEIPCTVEPGRLQPVRLQRVRHDWVTNTH